MNKRITKIALTTETAKSVPYNQFLGYEGEDNIAELVFEFTDGFVDGRAKLVLLRENMEAGYLDLVRIEDTYILPVKSALVSKNGDITFCLTIINDNNEIVVKYDPFVMTVKDAPDTDIPMPEDYPTWQKIADDKLMEIDRIINQIEEDLASGKFKGEKGDKGDAGSIKFIIVSELPTENIDESAIYMKQSTNQEEQNTYEEFIYVNGTWESIGNADVEVDLTDYVKRTDYASSSKAGVVKMGNVSTGLRVVNGQIYVYGASNTEIDSRTTDRPITPKVLVYAVQSVVGAHVTLTQAEYDSLVESDSVNQNTYYYIVEEE